jgi:ubiquinone/menaquinone biosynthesis C-methylase UbiE
MYRRSAVIYDAIYHAQGKDYSAEAQRLCALIQEFKQSDGNLLLDVACGTGNHLSYLKKDFEVEGLDNAPKMLRVAAEKFPRIAFHLADMVSFELDHAFDVIICLFSAIGHVQTLPHLAQAINSMAKHLLPGGVIMVEPWFEPGALDSGKPHATFVDEPELKIARMNINRVEGNLSYLSFHYLIATPKGIEYFDESDALGLFTHDQYLQAFLDAGLEVFRDEKGLDGRGLYIGRRNSQS